MCLELTTDRSLATHRPQLSNREVECAGDAAEVAAARDEYAAARLEIESQRLDLAVATTAEAPRLQAATGSATSSVKVKLQN